MISVDLQLVASIEMQNHLIQDQKDLINTQTNILKQIQMNVVLVDMIYENISKSPNSSFL